MTIQDPAYQELDDPPPPSIITAMEKQGVKRLYSHQVEAIEAVRRGEDVAVATPTASGKTITYNLPVFESILRDPSTKALYLFPLKALGQDQKKVIEQWNASLNGAKHIDFEVYDGDTSSYTRKKTREKPPQILITNPDMLHLSILAHHAQWRKLFENLRFVVVDEVHTYKGVFGSHIVQIFRRLNRVCRFYGARPNYVVSSATIANPHDFCKKLFGRTFRIIQNSGAPQSGRHVIFFNPQQSPYSLASRLFQQCVNAGFKTIAFTKARRITELIHRWIVQQAPDLSTKVSSYRAGYLPEERREIEQRLSSGELDGVISTSALEMGIDIGGLDVCILVGYPGTVIRTWQRGGRVGRGKRDSLICLIAQQDALDQYFMHHPENFFGRSYEAAVVDPNNRKIIKGHMLCAAAEIPLNSNDEDLALQDVQSTIDELQREGLLLQSATGTEWFAAGIRPTRNVEIRGIGKSYDLFEEGPSKTLVGSVSGSRVLSECHPGAIYLHKARQFLVTELDMLKKDVILRPVEVSYYTQALMDKDTEILDLQKSASTLTFRVHRGRIRVTEKVVGYEKRSVHGREILSAHPLQMPANIFETIGMWLEVDDPIKKEIDASKGHFMGGIHAIEHTMIALFPLFALCDRDDIGGISFTIHPQVGRAAIFVYDGYTDGVGLSERAYEVVDNLLEKVLELMLDCPCEVGCPSCIYSPKCGSGNRPLDKKAAVTILQRLMGKNGGTTTQRPTGSGEMTKIPPASIENAKEEGTGWGVEGNFRVYFFDLETQRSAEEVGGWHNCHNMRLAIGVIFDAHENRYLVYEERQIHELISELNKADLIIGFNIKRFDYKVLKGYGEGGLSALPTFDILEDIYNKLGFRLSLSHLGEKNLGLQKTADGLQSIEWFRHGMVDKVIEYCKKDVAITRELFEFGRQHGYILFEHRSGQTVRMPVTWDLEKIIIEQKEKGYTP
jgi:DEAD/DEAH box helicase domain-containing protein